MVCVFGTAAGRIGFGVAILALSEVDRQSDITDIIEHEISW
jgi:hypothetical protein